MTALRIALSRLFGLLRTRRMERDLDDEIGFHMEMEIAENVRRGMPPDEARAAAMRKFGGVARTKEVYREAHGLPAIEIFRNDVRFGLRMLRRNPAFAFLAILCLTLGIGSNAAVFSWIEGILIRPYPAVAHQERMMAVAGTNRSEPGHTGMSWPDFKDLERSCTSFDAFIADKITGTTLSIGDRAERVPASIVSSNYFDALGVRPILGRGFRPEEEQGRNAHSVAVISYQLWRERFHGDPAIIGKTQMMNGMPHTIVGVAPQGFYGTFVGWSMQFWVPASMQERFDPTGYKLEDRSARWIEGFVRLKPGVTPERAQTEISAAAKRLEAIYPETNRGRGVQLYPLWRTPFNGAGALLPALSVAVAVVFLVLLIACANVSSLLLSRALGRRREMTVRLAVGAGRGRLLKQLLTEGLLLTAIAAAAGILFANWCRNLLVLLLPQRGPISMYLPGEIDSRVLALSAGVCLAATLLFGLAPALQASRIDLAASLKEDSGGAVGRRRAVARSGLVVAQVALSFVLLVTGVLLLRSFHAMQNTNPGFETRDVLASSIDLIAAGYDTPRIKAFEDDMIDRLQSRGGIESAAFVRNVPFTYRSYSSAAIAVDGYVSSPDEQPTVEYDEVGPSYFATMGIPLVSGREFTRADNETARPVAVVNQMMAAQFWRGRDPIGSRVQVNGRWLSVIGVAKMSKYGNLTEVPRPFFYVPLRQNPPGLALVIRTRLRPDSMASALAREVHALDANVAPGEVVTMQEEVDRTTGTERVALTMLNVFGSLAVALAAIGLYGLMSYAVSQSRRELGLRMALGADGTRLLRSVMAQGLTLTVGGIMVGGAAALLLTRLLGSLLYRTNPRDPAAFALGFVVMIFASLLACFLPAWRAMKTDPARALRE